MKHRLTLILTGGGSGGHITPLLSLAHALKKADPKCRIVYIGLKGDKLEGLQARYQVFDEVYTVPAGKFRRYHGEGFLASVTDFKSLFFNARDFFRLLMGIFAAFRLLKKIKPDKVFSKGGYVAVPVGVAAHWQKIPIVTHDSDTVPGLANRIIGRWAEINATGMPAGHYAYPKHRTRYVGIPVDERIKPLAKSLHEGYKKKLGVPSHGLVLLIGGAGLGSKTINNKTAQIIPELLKSFPELYVFHIAGTMHENDVKNTYKEILTEPALQRVKVLGFTPDFYMFTGAADLVITRAGATTIAELAIQAKPALLIPAPFLTGGQQLKNAEELAAGQAAEVAPNDISTDDLYEVINRLLRDSKKRAALSARIAKLAKPNAADELAAIILKSPGGKV